MRDPRHPFAIMLASSPDEAPLVVTSAANADQATIAFHAELQRLRREQVQGEMWVQRLDQEQPPLLRVTLHETAVPRSARRRS